MSFPSARVPTAVSAGCSVVVTAAVHADDMVEDRCWDFVLEEHVAEGAVLTLLNRFSGLRV
jgi:hypothetical protein